jgi:hypothetical protein
MAEAPLGYKSGVKSAVVKALQAAMPAANVGIEYPMVKGEYPYIYIEYTASSLGSMGIGHMEVSDTEQVNGVSQRDVVRRWEFSGGLSFSFFALKAKERDTLSDEFVAAVGFNDTFRDSLKVNNYIAIDVQTEEVTPAGDSASPGTPWGTDDVVYYTSYELKTRGDFFSHSETAGIIERIDTYPRREDEPDLPDSTHGAWE